MAFQGDVEYHDQTSREDQTYRIWIFSGGGFTDHGDGGEGRYEIANGHGPVLTANMSTCYAQINTWKGSPTQKWEVLPLGADAHRIRISDQDCLTSHEDHKKLGVWTCDGSEGQRRTIAR